ncbi:PP2C family protein-serine/threonine phosphatase [Methylocucumis oryzae]|uniref:PPM-type phosphatase domain-containing protein n=1 Tax=Methylocucumis oryzae TaxID=1632867 RepID=A0A0F3IMH5_9GAMM|nr:PP2C family protein-serine/threonine phosphatase [Methylocucumis oryzae]KJV07728.1 hypothetical protein VZ94_02710 [Methylocucumis oryzae]
MLKTKDLLQTIHAINEILCEENPTCMFLTLNICIIDSKKQVLEYVNGGHNRPIFGNFRDGFNFLSQPKGILVGIKSKTEYELASRQLNPGDVLILYTDGITEAMNPKLEEFTEHRLLAHINLQQSFFRTRNYSNHTASRA